MTYWFQEKQAEAVAWMGGWESVRMLMIPFDSERAKECIGQASCLNHNTQTHGIATELAGLLHLHSRELG